jgi:hypothetical protein
MNFILGIEQNYVGRQATHHNITNGTGTVLDVYQGKIGRETDVVAFVLANPDRVAYSWFKNTWHMLAQRLPYKFPIWLFAISGLGLFGAAWNRKRFKREIYMIMVVLFPVISYGFYVTSARSAMLTVALLIIWLANGTDLLNGWFAKTLPRISLGKLEGIKSAVMRSDVLKKIPLIVVLLSILPLLALPAQWENPPAERSYLAVGDWLGDNTPEGSKIMVTNSEIAFYGGRTYMPIHYGNYTQIIEYAELHGAGYIVATWDMTEVIPFSAPLLEPETMPPNIELVYDSYDSGDENRVLVYRVVSNQP